jgi:integral membrane protein (TIGR01906 family)
MRGLVRLAITLTVPLALLMLNVWLLASEPYLRWEYSRPGFPAAEGLSGEERLALAVPSARFVVDGSRAPVLAAMTDGEGSLFTAAEISHMLDVRRLARRGAALAAAGVVLTVVAGIAWWRDADRRKPFLRAIERGGWLAVALVVLVGLGVAVAWPIVFVGFHRLFFAAGTWSFPVDSGLIRLYPERFWFDAAVALAALTALEGLAVALVARLARTRVADSGRDRAIGSRARGGRTGEADARSRRDREADVDSRRTGEASEGSIRTGDAGAGSRGDRAGGEGSA